MRLFIYVVLMATSFVSICSGCSMKPTNTEDPMMKIRPAKKAGAWYEGSSTSLKKQLNGFFRTADITTSPVRALISPHAGYVYSGGTAAYGYKALEGCSYKRVIVLAPSHYAHFDGGSILDVTHYETPLGRIPLDREACDSLLSHDYFTTVPNAHSQEHSLELQLPFLQHTLQEGFTLIPIVISKMPESWYKPMAKLLLSYWDEKTLVVVSSDFTHFGPNFGYEPFTEKIPENLKKLDLGAVKQIIELNVDGFNDYIRQTEATICGRKPIGLLLAMARIKKMEAKLLHYSTSGELTKDFSNSVSYASICFTETTKEKSAVHDSETPLLSNEEQKTLLRLARHTLKFHLSTGGAPDDLSDFEITPALRQELGAFVTLTVKGRLRGCIGYLQGIKPVYKAIIDNTISAASKDPRFPAVAASEEPGIDIEISVLTPVVLVKDLEEIVVGRDGLIISQGYMRGTLLPQVPEEYGWNRTEFLEHTCRKAGLPLEAYKDPNTKIEKYSAQVFSEKP